MAKALVKSDSSTNMTKLEQHLLLRDKPKFPAYYTGKMSFALHGKEWDKYIAETLPDLAKQSTSENVFKDAIDLYAENLVPLPEKLRGFSNSLVPLLSEGVAIAVITKDGEAHFPEHFQVISDGKFTIAAIWTRNLEKMQDYVTFVYSNGVSRVFGKGVPDDMSAPSEEGYNFIEEDTGNELFRFALDDKGMGGTLMALQDRVNHSIIDQTVVEEMYARPFWYLLNTEIAPTNPYLPKPPDSDKALTEQKVDGAGGRIFTTSSEGPFGQLEPPTLGDMVTYHDSIIDKVSQSTGIPQYYFKPGSGTPPTGVALKVLSKRFNNKIARIREDIEPELIRMAEALGIEKTAEVVDTRKVKPTEDGEEVVETKPEMEYELWNTSDDLLQDSLDQHGINLSQMGYPLEYIATVVTPGVDLDDYMDDTDGLGATPALGTATDMTAAGQTGLPATPGQVQSYAQNPGQRAKVKS
jgi:hypothetical protein